METITDMNKLIEVCHSYALKQGFWDEDKIISEVRRIDNPDGSGNIMPIYEAGYVINKKLLLIISEITEAMEAMRKAKWANTNDTVNPFIINEMRDFEALIKDTFEDEIADTFIRLFDLCGWLKIDIVRHIQLKMSYNEMRPRLHDKKF